MTKNIHRSDSTFAAALSQAIDARNVSLTWLHRQLSDRGNPVSMATLSYWRSGARQPEGVASLAAVEDVEILLGLDIGTLSLLIQAVPRIGPLPAAYVPSDAEITQAIEEITAELGTTPPSGLRDLSTLITADVGPDGTVKTVTTRALVQSTTSVMSSIPLFDFVAAPDEEPKKIVDVRGARVAPPYLHPGGRVVCDLVELDQPVPPGGTTMLEFTEVHPAGHPATRWVSHTVSRPTRQTVIWVRFHPQAVPDWCEEYVDADGVETVRARDVSDGAVHAFRFGFGPATLGLRWGSDDDVQSSSRIQQHAVAL